MLTIVYLINRTPSPLLSNKTPYEQLFSKPPSYSHLRVFDCLCFVSTLSHNRSKFEPITHTCVFIGYPYVIKGCKVYNLVKNKILLSRDVTFKESIFPFQNSDVLQHVSSNESIVLPFPQSDDSLSSYPISLTLAPISSIAYQNACVSCEFVIPNSDTHLSSPISHYITQPKVRKSIRVYKYPSYLIDHHCSLTKLAVATRPNSLITGSVSSIKHRLSSTLLYFKL